MTPDDRDESRWDRCLLTPNCIHRHGHGGACEAAQVLMLDPLALYGLAMAAGLDLVAELQAPRKRVS